MAFLGGISRLRSMLAGAVVLLASAYAAPVAAQALEELLKQTIEPHDRVAAAQAEVDAQRNKAREALGDWFPTLTPTGTYGWEKQNKPGSTPNTSTGFGEFDLKISQLLWDFGATNAAVEKARLQLLEAEVKLVSARQDLMLEAVTAYVNLLRAHQVLAYAKQSEGNIRKQTGLEEARVESGAGLSTDVLQAKTQLAGAEARRIQAAGGLVSATNRFRAVFGREPGNASNLVPVSVSEAVLPIDLNSAVGIAQDNNAQLILANLTEAIAREDVNATKSKEFFPKIEGALEQKWKRNVAGTLDNQIETVAKVEVSIPFNLGFTGVNKLRAAQSTLIARTRTVADTRRRVEEQVRNAWDQLRTAKDTAASRRTQASIAEAFLDLARKERQLGQRSLIDVLSGETSLINAQSDAVSAETDVLVAAFGLIKEIGRLGYDSFRPPTGSRKGPDGDDAAQAEPPRPRGDAKAQAQALTRRMSLAGTAYETFTPMTPRKPVTPPAPKAKWTQPPPETSVAPLAPPEPKSAPTTAVTVDTDAAAAADLTLPPGGLTAPTEALPVNARPASREKADRPTPPPSAMPPEAAAVPTSDSARNETPRSAKVVSLPIDPAPAAKPPSGAGRAKHTKPPGTQRPANERNFFARIFSGANKPSTPVATAEVAPPPKAASTEVAERPPQPESTPPDRSSGFNPLTKDQDFFVWLFSHVRGNDENAARPAAPAPLPTTTADRQDRPVSTAVATEPTASEQLKDDRPPVESDRGAQPKARPAPPTEPAPRSATADNPVVALVGGFFGALASLFTGDVPKAQFDVPPPAAVKVAAAPAPPETPRPAKPAEPKELTKDQDFFVWLFSHARMPAAEGVPDATPEPASTGVVAEDAPAPVPVEAVAKPPAQTKATEPPPRIWRAQAAAAPALKGASASNEDTDNPIVTLVSGFFGALASLFGADLPATQAPSTPVAATPPPNPREPKAEPPNAIAERVPAAETKYDDPLLGGLVAFIANNRVFEPTPTPPKP